MTRQPELICGHLLLVVHVLCGMLLTWCRTAHFDVRQPTGRSTVLQTRQHHSSSQTHRSRRTHSSKAIQTVVQEGYLRAGRRRGVGGGGDSSGLGLGERHRLGRPRSRRPRARERRRGCYWPRRLLLTTCSRHHWTTAKMLLFQQQGGRRHQYGRQNMLE